MKRFAILGVLFSLFTVPSSAMAWKFVCDTFQVIECGDGTTFACSAGGQQIDCPDNPASWAAYEHGCADHGGIVGVTDENACSMHFEEDVVKGDEGGDETPSDEVTPTRRR